MEQSAEVSEKAEEAEGGKEEVAVEERGEGRQGEERAEAALVGQGMARPTKSRFDRTRILHLCLIDAGCTIPTHCIGRCCTPQSKW